MKARLFINNLCGLNNVDYPIVLQIAFSKLLDVRRLSIGGK